MKKTLITAVLALGLAVGASAAEVLSLNAEDLTKADGSYTIPDSAGNIGSGYGLFSITMVLNAEAFSDYITSGSSTTQTNILYVTGTGNNKHIGLGIKTADVNVTTSTTVDGEVVTDTTTIENATGIYASWNSSTSFSSSLGTDLSTLSSTMANKTYESVALTFAVNNGSGTMAYLTLVDSEGNITTISGNNSGNKSGSFGSLDAFTYNTSLVEYISISTPDVSTAEAITLNTNAIAAAKLANAVPEPATATLSLLAFAGLAARRRRK